jgi:hypothetical protein
VGDRVRSVRGLSHERRTHSYVRHGTTSLFAALDVASGFVIGKCYERHRAAEFLNFLKEVDAQIAEGLDIHIVMDNYATHKTPKIKAWLARRPLYGKSDCRRYSTGFQVLSNNVSDPNPLVHSQPRRKYKGSIKEVLCYLIVEGCQHVTERRIGQ